MILLGMGGFVASLLLCGVFLAAGINGWIGGTAAFAALHRRAADLRRASASAAPPAVQALVAGETTREERTRALTLLASAFGLGTILGPAIAPYLILGHVGADRDRARRPRLRRSRCFGVAMSGRASRRMLPDDRAPIAATHGAPRRPIPRSAAQPTGRQRHAPRPAAHGEHVGYLDPRIRGWMIAGLVMGHAQAMTGQAIGFLVIDRLGSRPPTALSRPGSC